MCVRVSLVWGSGRAAGLGPVGADASPVTLVTLAALAASLPVPGVGGLLGGSSGLGAPRLVPCSPGALEAPLGRRSVGASRGLRAPAVSWVFAIPGHLGGGRDS